MLQNEQHRGLPLVNLIVAIVDCSHGRMCLEIFGAFGVSSLLHGILKKKKGIAVCLQVSHWPGREKWTRKYLSEAFHGQAVVVGEYPMGFDDYLAYMDANVDEMPLYLFDKHFADKAPALAADYKVCQS